MITVQVDHIALIQCPALTGKQVELPDQASVSDLLHQIGIQAEHHKAVVPFINQERAKRSHRLKDGDAVFLSLAVGGG